MVGLVDPWDLIPPPRATDSLQTRMERLRNPIRFRLQPWHLLAGCLVTAAIIGSFIPVCGWKSIADDLHRYPQLRLLVMACSLALTAFIAVMEALPPRPLLSQFRRDVLARREARWIREARLPGPAQLERVLQLALPHTLCDTGHYELGNRLITLSGRHPRMPRALWRDAWVRTLVRSMADWDIFALDCLMGKLTAFIQRPGSPLAPHDGVDILVQAIRSARFPPGPPDGQRAAAVLRWRYVDRDLRGLMQLRPWDQTLQQHAITQQSAIVNEAAFQPWPFWGNAPRPELQQRGMGRRAAPRNGSAR